MTTENTPKIPAKDKLPGEQLVLPGSTIGGEVGTFYVDFTLWNWEMESSVPVNGLVDTGATYPQAPSSVLEELGVDRVDTVIFRLANGSRTELALGRVVIELDGRFRPVSIVFGPEGSNVLLGAIALEEFGLAADVWNQRLVPADILL